MSPIEQILAQYRWSYLTLKIKGRVTKKNLSPDKAIFSLTSSEKNLFVSAFQHDEGRLRNTFAGFFDSSLTLAAENDTIMLRNMRKIREYQKYTIR